jgi:hypothetical protein
MKMDDKLQLAPTAPQALTTTGAEAYAMATVQARYAIAVARPRDMDAARLRLLADCSRPRFAAVAIWRRPAGREMISGPSIRFVEAAIRAMGNVLVEAVAIRETAKHRTTRVTVTDIESNATYTRDVSVPLTVERRKLKRGQQPLGQRLNSYGDTVYVVEGTDAEIATMEAAQVSKAVRTLGLRLLPGDIVEEAVERVESTLADRDAKDPSAARKQLVDAFARLGVQPADLVGYLGHGLDGVQPSELSHLRQIHAAIAAGEAVWSDYTEPSDDAPKGQASKTARTLEALQARREASTPPDAGADSTPPADGPGG